MPVEQVTPKEANDFYRQHANDLAQAIYGTDDIFFTAASRSPQRKIVECGSGTYDVGGIDDFTVEFSLTGRDGSIWTVSARREQPHGRPPRKIR